VVVVKAEAKADPNIVKRSVLQLLRQQRKKCSKNKRIVKS